MNDELIAILDRIAKKEQTDADIQILRDWLSSGKKLVSQSGKYSINVEEGKDIYIGDRQKQSYYYWHLHQSQYCDLHLHRPSIAPHHKLNIKLLTRQQLTNLLGNPEYSWRAIF
jgi:Effector-associated domain 10